MNFLNPTFASKDSFIVQHRSEELCSLQPVACSLQPAAYSPNLALTHANDRYIDGAGAQLQRIYSIYALSRLLDIAYVHSPIKHIGYYGLAALEENKTTPELIARYNEAFAIRSDVEVPKTAIVHNLVRVDLDFLYTLKEASKNTSEFHLVRFIFSDPLTNQHPEGLRYIKEVSLFERAASPVFRIAIHVRRGDLFVAESERMLPNSYYLDIAFQTIEILNKLHIPFSCELHTELPSKKFVVTPEHYGFQNFAMTQNPSDLGSRIKNSVSLDPTQNCIEEFDCLPNLQKWINGDPIDSMKALATADLLITSRSCFSYVPALLNKKGIIVFHPFWHPPLSEWIDGTRNDILQKRLMECCQEWKNNHLS